MNRKEKEQYISENINSLNTESKIALIKEVNILSRDSLEETTIDNEKSLRLNTDLLTDDILDFMIEGIKDNGS